MGKSTINGSFSIAMLNYQRVLIIRGFEDLKRNSFSGSSLGDEEQVKQFSSAWLLISFHFHWENGPIHSVFQGRLSGGSCDIGRLKMPSWRGRQVHNRYEYEQLGLSEKRVPDCICWFIVPKKSPNTWLNQFSDSSPPTSWDVDDASAQLLHQAEVLRSTPRRAQG